MIKYVSDITCSEVCSPYPPASWPPHWARASHTARLPSPLLIQPLPPLTCWASFQHILHFKYDTVHFDWFCYMASVSFLVNASLFNFSLRLFPQFPEHPYNIALSSASGVLLLQFNSFSGNSLALSFEEYFFVSPFCYLSVFICVC